MAQNHVVILFWGLWTPIMLGRVQILQPQKRLYAKKALEACIGRLLELKSVSPLFDSRFSWAKLMSLEILHFYNSKFSYI